MLRFLDESQIEKLDAWIVEQDKKLFPDKEPYYGASGGSLTYMFTPTSLGVVVVVRNNLSNEEVDLTDYNAW